MNVAYPTNGMALQSSTQLNGEAEHAVDGKSSPQGAHQSYSLTDGQDTNEL